MKIGGTVSITPTAAPKPSRTSAAAGFAPEAAAATGSTGAARAGGSAALAGLDMLLALQEAGGPLERRRRAVRRGERLLDALDDLRLAVLAGAAAGESLARLGEAAAQAREGADDAGLDEVLGLIDLRVAVELAKEQRGSVTIKRR